MKQKGKNMELFILVLVLGLALSIKIFEGVFQQKQENSFSNLGQIENVTGENNKEDKDLYKKGFKEKEVDSQNIMIHVKGAVKKPGVYELPENSRVKDAVEQAGGFREDAEQEALNLAGFVFDAQEIVIPKKGETKQNPFSKEKGLWTIYDLNRATAEELTTLSGIGPSTAQKIITYKQQNGPFKNISDLEKVSGIGSKTLQEIKTSFEKRP